METISISIGDARSSTCIVLPRGHELVRHIEALLPATAPARTRSLSPESSPYSHPSPERVRYPLTSVPHSRAPMVLSPQPPVQAPVQAAVSAPVHAPASMIPPQEQPHRSAAFIQKLLHRPRQSSVVAGLVTTPPPNVYRRGRLATAAQGSNKRCQVPGCGKISVSRGVCRGHGGGRRCQFEGCTKSAQSRGDYCWGHGGGHRCEMPGCMRSRKSKRFCKNHLNWDSESPPRARERTVRPMLLPRAEAVVLPAPITPPPAPPPAFTQPTARLPSLHQALQTHHMMIYGAQPSLSSMSGHAAFPTLMASGISC